MKVTTLKNVQAALCERQKTTVNFSELLDEANNLAELLVLGNKKNAEIYGRLVELTATAVALIESRDESAGYKYSPQVAAAYEARATKHPKRSGNLSGIAADTSVPGGRLADRWVFDSDMESVIRREPGKKVSYPWSELKPGEEFYVDPGEENRQQVMQKLTAACASRRKAYPEERYTVSITANPGLVTVSRKS